MAADSNETIDALNEVSSQLRQAMEHLKEIDRGGAATRELASAIMRNMAATAALSKAVALVHVGSKTDLVNVFQKLIPRAPEN